MNDELIFFLISLRERRIFSKIVCFLLVCHTELFIRWYRVSPKYCLPTKHICPCPDCWGQSHSESPPKSGNLPFFRYSFTFFFFLVFFYTVHLNSHNAVDLYLHLILRDVALNLAVLFWFRENILFFGGCFPVFLYIYCSITTLYRNDLFLCLFSPPTVLATLGWGTIMTCFRTTTSQGGRGCLGRGHRRLLADMKTMWRCPGENVLLIQFENPGSQVPPPGPSSHPTLSRW